ncbi:uncharacterized protein LOC134222528 isoform X2 [Armigeres subalbatus]|uniref:uncharacterized protein LOC134222528 isoform X2 n=1 Tax=Armigeres subalbatus TaxID=124917 RepID=UPI002ED16329
MFEPQMLTVVAIFRISTNFGFFTCYSNLTLLSIKERFDGLQSGMINCLTSMKAPRSAISSSLRCEMVSQIAGIHHQLNDTILLFNRCFSFQVLHAITMTSFFTLFVVFGFIHAYTSEVNDVTVQVAWNNLLYDVFYVVMFIQLMCKKISIALQKTISYGCYDKRVFRELGRFSRQLEHHTSKISCGLCDFDWTLLYSIAGTFTMYLVILLQFDIGNLDFHRQ